MSSHHKPHHKPTHSRFMEAGDEIRNEGYYFRVCTLFYHDLFSLAKYWSQSFLETKLLSFAWGGFSMCWYLLCSQIFWFCFLLLQHSQQQIPPIWAAAVIGLSHILLHQSLNMTTGWWWFQWLMVMTALSPSLWSHFAICLFSPFPFFPLLFWAPSSEYNSIILRISASWRMTSALSQSIREAVGGGADACLNTRMNYSQHLQGWWRFLWFFLQYVMCVCL